jgi:hypothetical protein
MLETTLRRSSLGLVEATRQAQLDNDTNLLVLVDQFEEIFRLSRARRGIKAIDDQAAAFVKLLLEAIGQGEYPIYIALTMWSDFLGDCAQFRDLPEALNRSQFLIPRMTRDQQREAIEGPVAVGGATIEPRLVQRLLNDMGDDPDQLPILQHALMRTWDTWCKDGGPEIPLDLAHYEAIGTMVRPFPTTPTRRLMRSMSVERALPAAYSSACPIGEWTTARPADQRASLNSAQSRKLPKLRSC